jgi:pimeloyl-ACP methyl ester carboxylesterase
MIRSGTGEPLVLLHGVLGSERIWRDLIPLLEPALRHDRAHAAGTSWRATRHTGLPRQ